MTAPRFHLAQANVARMRAPLESPIMEGFRSQLEHINAVADASPGFAWRLQGMDGDATSIRAYEDERNPRYRGPGRLPRRSSPHRGCPAGRSLARLELSDTLSARSQQQEEDA
jgi:Domain of unknown function (DUF3291)